VIATDHFMKLNKSPLVGRDEDFQNNRRGIPKAISDDEADDVYSEFRKPLREEEEF
jgi:hypothetical protein